MNLIFTICIIIFVVKFSLTEVNSMPEESLRESLMATYNKDAIPHHNETHPVKVALSLSPVSIDIDERLRKMELFGFLKLFWTDSRLGWDPEKHDGIDELRMGVKDLWKPDISLNNRAHVSIDSPTDHASLFSTGQIVWTPWSHLTASCTHKATYYPFDTFNCAFKFGSWVYDGSHLDLELKRPIFLDDLSYIWESNEWEVASTWAEKRVNYKCCKPSYPDVTYYLTLRRQTSTRQVAILFPLISSLILTWTVLNISPLSKLRLFINAFHIIMLLFTLIYLRQLFPSFARKSPVIVFIYEILFLTGVLAMVWSIWLMSLNRSWVVPKTDNTSCNEQLDHSYDDLNYTIDMATEDKRVVMSGRVKFYLFFDGLIFFLPYAVFFSSLIMWIFEEFD